MENNGHRTLSIGLDVWYRQIACLVFVRFWAMYFSIIP